MFKLEGAGVSSSDVFFAGGGGGGRVISGSLQYTTTPLKPCGWLRTFAAPVGVGGGVLPYKSDGGACRKISRTPLKGTRIVFYGRVPNSSPPLSQSKRY